MKKVKKIMGIFLACVMIFSLAALTVSAQEVKAADVYDITVELNYPAPAAGVLTKFFEDLEEQSEGRLKFTIYYGYSLNGEAGIMDALQMGIVQVAGLMPYNEPEQLPYSGALFNMPFLGFTDMKAATDIWWDMYNTTEEMSAEYERAGLTVIAASANPIYDLHFKENNGVRVPADLAGLQVISGVPEIQKIITNAGGAPVESGPGDYYENIDKGVADGIIQHINILTSFGCSPELLKYHVRFEEAGGGFVTSIINVVWNTESLSSLPEDLQALIMERAATLSDEMVSNDAGLVSENYALAEENGEVVYLTPEEGELWREAAEPVVEEALQKYVDNGADKIIDMYNVLKEKIAAYDAE